MPTSPDNQPSFKRQPEIINERSAKEKNSNKIFLGAKRRQMLEAIISAVQEIAGGSEVQDRVFKIIGELGTGKTELVKHLKSLLEGEGDNTLVQYISFSQFTSEKRRVTDQDLEDFIKLRKEEVLTNDVVILILDDLLSLPQELVQFVEDKWLNDLIANPNVIIVMTGRRNDLLFSNYNLNNRYKKIPLPPLASDELKELLATVHPSLREEDIELIYKASGGQPGIALSIAQAGFLGQGVKETLKKILQAIPLDEQIKIEIFQGLEAFSSLNRWKPGLIIEREGRQLPINWGFIDSDAQNLMGAYHFFKSKIQTGVNLEKTYSETELNQMFQLYDRNASYYQPPKTQMRQLKIQLIDYGLIHWSSHISDSNQSQASGHFIREPINFLIAHNLQLNQPGLWQWLHYVAWKLFSQWEKSINDQEHQELFKNLAQAHEQAWRELVPGTKNSGNLKTSV